MANKDSIGRTAPKDRIGLYLDSARAACIEQRDHYKHQANEVKTGNLNDPEKKREFESVLEDLARFQFGIEQIELLQRYLS